MTTAAYLTHYPLTNVGCNDANKLNQNFLDLDSAISGASERSMCIAVKDSTTSVTVADGKVMFAVPDVLSGYVLTAALARVYDKGVTGAMEIQIRRRRGATDSDMLSTKITVGDEYFASDGTVNAIYSDVTAGDAIFVDVDAVHSGTAPRGLSVTLTFTGS
jgi:hypothetical protein